MLKFDVTRYKRFEELPLIKFNEFNYCVYVISTEWNYLFVNDFSVKNLGERGIGLVGQNMWSHFTELSSHPGFLQMKQDTERGLSTDFTTISPLTNQRLNIVGQPLSDCYYFTASILPNKEDVISDLRRQLKLS